MYVYIPCACGINSFCIMGSHTFKEFLGEYMAKNTGNPVCYRYFTGRQLITEQNESIQSVTVDLITKLAQIIIQFLCQTIKFFIYT